MTTTELLEAFCAGNRNFNRADLREADLREADLRGARGVVTAAAFMEQYPVDATGILVLTQKPGPHKAPPAAWTIAPGAVLTETVNPDRCTECGCGVSFAAPGWFQPEVPNLWLARIAWVDLADVVVPFGTDGKARCGRLTLLRRVTTEELTAAQAGNWVWVETAE